MDPEVEIASTRMYAGSEVPAEVAAGAALTLSRLPTMTTETISVRSCPPAGTKITATAAETFGCAYA